MYELITFPPPGVEIICYISVLFINKIILCSHCLNICLSCSSSYIERLCSIVIKRITGVRLVRLKVKLFRLSVSIIGIQTTVLKKHLLEVALKKILLGSKLSAFVCMKLSFTSLFLKDYFLSIYSIIIIYSPLWVYYYSDSWLPFCSWEVRVSINVLLLYVICLFLSGCSFSARILNVQFNEFWWRYTPV